MSTKIPYFNGCRVFSPHFRYGVMLKSIGYINKKNKVKHVFTALFVRAPIVALLATGLQVIQPVYGQGINPLGSDPRAARVGGSIFRAQCATCHGADGKGIESIDAPDLTQIFTRPGVSDEFVFQIIKDGIPGSIMPANAFPEVEVWMLVSYLRSVGVSGISEQIQGDPVRGKSLFSENCETCHRVEGQGGSLGPNLSMIAAVRSQGALTNSVRNPSTIIGRQYKPVSIVTTENERIQGLVKSEDAFSIQIMDITQVLRGFRKSSLREVVYETQSVMPAFSESVLSSSELTDILSYLQSNL